jgi:hypothetical protein
MSPTRRDAKLRSSPLHRLTLLLAAALLGVTAVLGILGTHRALKDARDIERVVEPVRREIALLAREGSPRAKRLTRLGRHPARLRTVAGGFALLSMLAVSCLLLSCFGRGVLWAPLLLAATGGALYVGSPDYTLGPGTPLSAWEWSLLTGSFALGGALASLGVALRPGRPVLVLPAAEAPRSCGPVTPLSRASG